MKEFNSNFYRLICHENDSYKSDIIETLNTRTKEIAAFFGVEKVDKPIIRDNKYITNKSHIVRMQGIDDIDFNEFDDVEIVLTIGTEKIIFDVLGSYIHNVES